MSRIQQILNKAEREGTLRTRAGATEEPRRLRAAGQTSGVADGQGEKTPLEARERPATFLEIPGGQAEAVRMSRLVVSAFEPHSAAAEQFRLLRARLARLDKGRVANKAILMTSPGRGDGKTVTAVNLAVTMARDLQRRVVIVDADMRSPGVHRLLGLPVGPGLADVLAGDASLEEVAIEVVDLGLTVLPAGSSPQHPAELLGSAAMRRLMDQLRSTFDRIVVDTPPAAPLADVGVLSPLADGVLVVVRAGMTGRPELQRTLDTLDPARLLGLVLNNPGTAAPVNGRNPGAGRND
jgi:protein-tyrosine kinase